MPALSRSADQHRGQRAQRHRARDLSSLLINGATISGNQGDGIILGSLSMMEASGETNTVSSNAGWA